LISVIIPTNRKNTSLVNAVKSTAFASKNLQIEILIVVNNTEEDIESSVSWQLTKSERELCTFLYSGKGSLSDALNFGIDASNFELIARMDHDDEMLQNRLSMQSTMFINQPELVLLGGGALMVDKNGLELGEVKFPTSDTSLRYLLRFGNCFAHPTVMYRKAAFYKVGGYSNNFPFAEDYDLFARLSDVGQVANLPDLCVKYTIDSAQTSSIHLRQQISSAMAIVTTLGIKDFGINEILSIEKRPLNTDRFVAKNLNRLSPVKELIFRNRIRGRIALSIARRNYRRNIRSAVVSITCALILNFCETIRAAKLLISKNSEL